MLIYSLSFLTTSKMFSSRDGYCMSLTYTLSLHYAFVKHLHWQVEERIIICFLHREMREYILTHLSLKKMCLNIYCIF